VARTTSYTTMRRRVVRPYRWKLNRIAWCESRGRWWLATGNGFYGGLQFLLRTWRSVGGWSYPHLNTKLEQMYRAVLLIRRAGYRPWPRCGYA
jgi:resuscitation-promoting factor RpfE